MRLSEIKDKAQIEVISPPPQQQADTGTLKLSQLKPDQIEFVSPTKSEESPGMISKALDFTGGIARATFANRPEVQAIRALGGEGAKAFSAAQTREDLSRAAIGEAPKTGEFLERAGVENKGLPGAAAGALDIAFDPVIGGAAGLGILKAGKATGKVATRGAKLATKAAGGIPEIIKDAGAAAAAETFLPGGLILGPLARRGLKALLKSGKKVATKKASKAVAKSADDVALNAASRGGLLGETTGKAVVTSGKAVPKTSRAGLVNTVKKTPKPRAKIPNVAGKKMTKQTAEKFAEVVKRRSDKFQSARAGAKDFDALVQVGKKRGMKKPEKWASHVLKGRKAKIEKRIKEAEEKLNALKGN